MESTFFASFQNLLMDRSKQFQGPPHLKPAKSPPKSDTPIGIKTGELWYFNRELTLFSIVSFEALWLLNIRGSSENFVQTRWPPGSKGSAYYISADLSSAVSTQSASPLKR